MTDNKNKVVQLEHYPDALILTVTRRLALRLEQKITKESGLGYIQPIFAIQDWFYQLWEHVQLSCGDATQVLTPLQEQAVWLKQILSSRHGHDLLKPKQTAKQMMQTWKLLCEWQLNPQELEWGDGQEHQICHRWITQFEQALANRQSISRSQLPNQLLETLKSNSDFVANYITTQTIILSGFDDYTPQVQSWLDWFESLGLKVLILTPNNTSQVHRCTFDSSLQELYYVATHARNWAKAHTNDMIGIVVPDLVKSRQQVESVFNQVCSPQACTSPDTQVSWDFNISAGLPMQKYPIIESLLLSFDLLRDKIPTSTWLYFLQSPFVELDSPELMRMVQVKIQQLKKPTVSIDEISQFDLNEAPLLQSYLKLIPKAKKVFNQQFCLSDWLKHLIKWKDALNWPGPRRLNSPEHQVMARFFMLLKEWATIEDELMPWPEAFIWLKTLCNETTFQPESNPVQIQIMGLLEAAGQNFDKIWVLGLNSETWPAKPAPDPFIPYSIQLENQMPHSTPARELSFAKHLIDNLIQSAPIVAFSYATTAQGKSYSPSPLIEPFAVMETKEIPSETIESKLFSQANLHKASKEKSIPLEQASVKGGVWLIQDQSQCPFRAFAKYRLHVDDLSLEPGGVSALTRGQLLHQALADIWDELQDWHQLQRLNDEQLESMITEVLLKLANNYPLPSLYGDIEMRRLKLLLSSWMTLERTRNPFKVAKTETNAQIQLDSMTLNCRLDRVDVDESGHFMIVDYKSGHVSLKDCFGERPDAPQLPLYCFANFPKNPKAIVYAQIKRDGCQFIGVSEQDNILPNVLTMDKLKINDVPPDWGMAISQWRQTLNALADEFMAGVNQVAPKSPMACRYCHLPKFCRVMESKHG